MPASPHTDRGLFPGHVDRAFRKTEESLPEVPAWVQREREAAERQQAARELGALQIRRPLRPPQRA